ncbi:TetR/AcrR family transcriptional regulator [Wenjunlia vitaminophila]|nr:TetR/AcrR family transcriptional regulator [Wenjunlia vitaminophila]
MTEPRLRADACRNRERILAAACEALVEHGPEVSIEEIARRAGVGNATIYRRFCGRHDLLHHVGLEVLGVLTEEAERARAEEVDALSALRRFAHRASNRSLAAVLPMVYGQTADDEPLHAARERLLGLVKNLMTSAQTTGMMRNDLCLGDFLTALAKLTRPLPGSPRPVVDTVRRQIDLLIDGLRTQRCCTCPERPASSRTHAGPVGSTTDD